MGKVARFTVGLEGGPEVTIEPYEALDVGDATESEAAEQIRSELNIQGIEFAKAEADSATVTVEFTYTYSGSVEVELHDLGGIDPDEVQDTVERGDCYEVTDAVQEDIGNNIDDMYIAVDSVNVDEVFDENGDSIDF